MLAPEAAGQPVLEAEVELLLAPAELNDAREERLELWSHRAPVLEHPPLRVVDGEHGRREQVRRALAVMVRDSP
ncbi:MAG: hypothetical protein QME94_10440 [Anaerolineae bacterium]|nr:hypothetical protein [Anaerolineae bacterium]